MHHILYVLTKLWNSVSILNGCDCYRPSGEQCILGGGRIAYNIFNDAPCHNELYGLNPVYRQVPIYD